MNEEGPYVHKILTEWYKNPARSFVKFKKKTKNVVLNPSGYSFFPVGNSSMASTISVTHILICP